MSPSQELIGGKFAHCCNCTTLHSNLILTAGRLERRFWKVCSLLPDRGRKLQSASICSRCCGFWWWVTVTAEKKTQQNKTKTSKGPQKLVKPLLHYNPFLHSSSLRSRRSLICQETHFMKRDTERGYLALLERKCEGFEHTEHTNKRRRSGRCWSLKVLKKFLWPCRCTTAAVLCAGTGLFCKRASTLSCSRYIHAQFFIWHLEAASTALAPSSSTSESSTKAWTVWGLRWGTRQEEVLFHTWTGPILTLQ